MPRPKRTKVASTVPTRVTKSKAVAPTPATRKPSAQLADQQVDTVSDDSDGLVVKATKPRSIRRSLFNQEQEDQNDADLTMAGGLPVQELDGGLTKTKSRRRVLSPRVVVSSTNHNTPSSNASRKTRSAASGRGLQRREPSSEGVRPSTMATYIAPTGEDDESSMLDPSLLTFGSLDSDSPAHGTRPPSAMKFGATPAHETSILALKNFKRRPRQLSLLHQTHQTTDVEDNHDLYSDDLEELDDFLPDAESTPLHTRKLGPDEKMNENNGLSLSSTSSRAKKRKLSPVIQVPRSSPPYDPPSGPDISNSRNSLSPSLPEVIESQEVPETQEEPDQEREPESEILSETMAPPLSSSSDLSEVEESPVKPRQRRKRAATRKGSGQYDSDGSDGAGTERPRRAQARSKKPQKPAFSTAKLQALLPRRRNHVAQERDEFDVESSDEVQVVDSDEDELQAPMSRLRKTTVSKSKPKSTKKTAKAAKKHDKSAVTTRRNTRTYGRRISSDKENENAIMANEDSEDVDESTEIAVTALPSTQLAAIAKRFEDVDAWEMDFESIDVTGGSSSPWR
ncbi:hypothetical protein B0J11DRAFT_533712 [Dendryphion nanum]|uniref:Uncharacterized protein n=1 Tax=Dendryphion nanum TaxID=256645 RepID=A0A9P9DKM0_9PLEO|nr:hypothetical protein B0J11DRAFT_533712 [Dendryphion nanum]